MELSGIKSMQVLLIGGTGFIGRHILARLMELEAKITILSLYLPGEYNGSLLNECRCLKGDIRDQKNREIISKTDWDIVINVGGFINQKTDQHTDEEVIAGHFTHVRELIALLPKTIQRFVHAGSAAEYGNNPVPHLEDMRECPLTPYAAAKVACTHYLQMQNRSNGFPIVILRPFFVYGPGQDNTKFLPWLIDQASNNNVIEMTKGDQTRDPIYIADVAEAFIRASIAPNIDGEVINVATGENITIKQIAQTVVDIMGRGKLNIGAIPYRDGEQMFSTADINKMRIKLGMLPSTKFFETIRCIIQGGYRH
jgi:nucleoside-diphosphate-sugar epimerase